MTAPNDTSNAAPLDLVVHRFSAAVTTRWRNGGGITRELVRVPSQGDFDWRISVAEVAADGPFSEFAEYDRIIVLLSGVGMDLHFDDDNTTVALRPPLGMHRFSGARPVRATLVEGATTDFNLMWRRSSMNVSFEKVAIQKREQVGNPAMNVVFVAAGAVRIANGTTLDEGDVAVFQGRLTFEGEGMLLWCSFTN